VTRRIASPSPSSSRKNNSSRVGKVKLNDHKKRTSSSRQWLLRQLNDPYVEKARDTGYRSRAAYKLLEIDAKYHFLKPGITVVDLGAAPGGWTQVASEKLKAGTHKGQMLGSRILAVDLCEMPPLNGVTILMADFTDVLTVEDLIKNLPDGVNVLLSDMAAPACGMTDVDHIRIMHLVEAAYDFACIVLKPGGVFVAKVLRGGTEASLLCRLKKSFTKVTHFKPPSSRKDSAEMYVIARGFRKKTVSMENNSHAN
jgi:23S rRNA (uridine2552-2'-O)-methyltransferase